MTTTNTQNQYDEGGAPQWVDAEYIKTWSKDFKVFAMSAYGKTIQQQDIMEEMLDLDTPAVYPGPNAAITDWPATYQSGGGITAAIAKSKRDDASMLCKNIQRGLRKSLTTKLKELLDTKIEAEPFNGELMWRELKGVVFPPGTQSRAEVIKKLEHLTWRGEIPYADYTRKIKALVGQAKAISTTAMDPAVLALAYLPQDMPHLARERAESLGSAATFDQIEASLTKWETSTKKLYNSTQSIDHLRT